MNACKRELLVIVSIINEIYFEINNHLDSDRNKYKELTCVVLSSYGQSIDVIVMVWQ